MEKGDKKSMLKTQIVVEFGNDPRVEIYNKWMDAIPEKEQEDILTLISDIIQRAAELHSKQV